MFLAPGLKAKPEEVFWSTLRGVLWDGTCLVADGGVLLGLRRRRDLEKGMSVGVWRLRGWSGVTTGSGPREPSSTGQGWYHHSSQITDHGSWVKTGSPGMGGPGISLDGQA